MARSKADRNVIDWLAETSDFQKGKEKKVKVGCLSFMLYGAPV